MCLPRVAPPGLDERAPLRGSRTRWVLQRCEQLIVQRGVRVQAAALIACAPTGSIGEATACFLDQEDPRRMIPEVVALGQKGVDLAANKFD